MAFELWHLTLGVLLVAVTMAASALKRLPLTTTMFHLRRHHRVVSRSPRSLTRRHRRARA
jgi:hypothetical protein